MSRVALLLLRRWGLFAPALLALCLWAGPGGAESYLELCNEDDQPYLVVLVERQDILVDVLWYAHGWYEVGPGLCNSWRYGGNAQIFLSVNRYGDEKGREVLDYGADAVPEWFWDTETYGVERFFCVSDEPFERWGESIIQETCAVGEYAQLFNLFVFLENHSSYTLNLN